MSRIIIFAFAFFLCACSSNVLIEEEAREKLTKEKAKVIRKVILADEKYSGLYQIGSRNFYFGSCDNPELNSNREPISCDYSIWLGLTREYGCVENVYVNVTKSSIEILDGITLCR